MSKKDAVQANAVQAVCQEVTDVQIKRGRQAKPMKPLYVRAFDEVLAHVCEIRDAMLNHKSICLSGSRLTAADYYICFQQACQAANLNCGLQNKLKKLLRGEEIGVGARNMLIVKIAPFLVSREFALFPKTRFFVSNTAWIEAKRKRLSIPRAARSEAEVVRNHTLYLDANAKKITQEEHRAASEAVIEAKHLAAKRLADADAEAARWKDTEAEDAAILASYNMNVELARNGFQYPDALEFFDPSDAFARQDQGLALTDLDQVQ